jgi:predicted SAM-dependent methyltransferase
MDLQVPTTESKYIHTLQGSILNLCAFFPEGSIDHILSEFTFEHLELKDILDLLYQMSLVWKYNGTATIRVPNFQYILDTFETLCHNEQGTGKFDELTLISLRIFCNERESMHKSVWTPSAGLMYLGMDNLFDVELVSQAEDFDGTMTYNMVKKQ